MIDQHERTTETPLRGRRPCVPLVIRGRTAVGRVLSGIVAVVLLVVPGCAPLVETDDGRTPAAAGSSRSAGESAGSGPTSGTGRVSVSRGALFIPAALVTGRCGACREVVSPASLGVDGPFHGGALAQAEELGEHWCWQPLSEEQEREVAAGPHRDSGLVQVDSDLTGAQVGSRERGRGQKPSVAALARDERVGLALCDVRQLGDVVGEHGWEWDRVVGEDKSDDTVAGLKIVRGESLDPREGQREHHHEQSGDLSLERHVYSGEKGPDTGVVVLDIGKQDGLVGLSERDDEAGIDESAVARPRNEPGQLGGSVAVATQVVVEVCLGQVSEGSSSPVEPAQ